MNRKEPLDELASFYKALDAIPTPPLEPKRPRRWGYLSLALAPFGATLIAYAFISFCASGPTEPGGVAPLRLSIDRYARDEIRSAVPTRPSPTHTSNDNQSEKTI